MKLRLILTIKVFGLKELQSLEWIQATMKQTDFIFIHSAMGEGIQASKGYKSMTAMASGCM